MNELILSKGDFLRIKPSLAASGIVLNVHNLNDKLIRIDPRSLNVYDALRVKSILGNEKIDHSAIKVELFILGGGMKGFASGVIVSLFERLNWGKLFSNIWTTSAGIHSATYLADGTMQKGVGKTFIGACIYPEVLARQNFFDFKRLFSGRLVDTSLLEDTISNGTHSLDVKSVSKYPVPIFAAITEDETMNGVLKQINSLGDDSDHIIDWSMASSSIPGITKPRKIQGKKWLDGTLNSIFKLYLEKNKTLLFTHVLVIPNTSKLENGDICQRGSLWGEIINLLLLGLLTSLKLTMRRKWRYRFRENNNHWKILKQKCKELDIPVEIMWSPESDVTTTTCNEEAIWGLGKATESIYAKKLNVKRGLHWK